MKTKLFTIWSFANECYQWPLPQHLFLWAFLISVNSNSYQSKSSSQEFWILPWLFLVFHTIHKISQQILTSLSSKYTHDAITSHDHYCCIPGPSHYHFLPKLFNGFIIGLPILCAVSLPQLFFTYHSLSVHFQYRSQGYHFKILSQMTLCHFQSLPFTCYLTHINEHLFDLKEFTWFF